jgi:hypothetical protein
LLLKPLRVSKAINKIQVFENTIGRGRSTPVSGFAASELENSEAERHKNISISTYRIILDNPVGQ